MKPEFSFIDAETMRSLIRLRDTKAQREINKGKQRKLNGWVRREGGNIK